MARDHAATLRKMFAKANNGAVGEAERDVILEQALAFASKHGIDVAMLEGETESNPVIDRKGTFTNPFAKDKSRLWNVIALNFGCQCVFLRNGIIHTYGYKSDVELTMTMFKLLWEHGLYELSLAVVPEHVSGRSFSTAFWAGYVNKIRQRLDESRNIAVAETTGAELVLVTRGKAVNDKMNTDYPHLGKVAKRYIRSASGWAAGTIAGERASLGKQIANE